MCGSYHTEEETFQELEVLLDEEISCFLQKGDILPARPATALVLEEGKKVLKELIWGFPTKSSLLINARSETAEERISFRYALQKGRCVLPATSFYEKDGYGQKHRFYLPERSFFLAGIHQELEGTDRFVILTREANNSVRPYHERMPLIISLKDLEQWLKGDYRALLKKDLPLFEQEDLSTLQLKGKAL